MSERRIRAAPLAAIVAASALCGCAGPQDFLSPEGASARAIAELGGLALIVFTATTVIVWLLIGVLLLRRRAGSFDEHAPATVTQQGHGWIYVGGIAIPAFVLSAIFGLSLHTLGGFPMKHSGNAQIRVTGRQWWFDAEYLGDVEDRVHVPTELHIPAGQPIDLELLSGDVIHSFWIPKLHGKVDMVPGLHNRIRIEADRPGVYDGECGEFCGEQHAHMRLEVVAQAPEEFARWLDRQRGDADAPASEETRRGHDVFMRAACPICHTIRGTDAKGTVGPDLTHVASRRRIAGGMLPNDTANLEAWITHAQSLKPGARMPDLPQFRGQELRDLTAYVQSLK